MPDEIEDPLDLTKDATQAKELSAAEQLKRQVEIDDFKWLMAEARGRRFAWRLLEKCGVFRSSFTGDSNWTNFREGQRNVGLLVLGDIHEHCPEAYASMLQEQKVNA